MGRKCYGSPKALEYAVGESIQEAGECFGKLGGKEMLIMK
jgi:hypothetical protein